MDDMVCPGIEDSLEPIRNYVSQAALATGLSRQATYNLCLAVDEIATNVVEHGYKEAGLSGNIKIGAFIEEDNLVIRMEDEGTSYDPTKHELPNAEHLGSPLSERSMGGLGILLAKRGVDDLQYASTGRTNIHRFLVALKK